jgi:hypothetical protein
MHKISEDESLYSCRLATTANKWYITFSNPKITNQNNNTDRSKTPVFIRHRCLVVVVVMPKAHDEFIKQTPRRDAELLRKVFKIASCRCCRAWSRQMRRVVRAPFGPEPSSQPQGACLRPSVLQCASRGTCCGCGAGVLVPLREVKCIDLKSLC